MWTRLRAIVSRLTFMLARRRLDEDMRLEIDAHLESLTEHYRRQGMSPRRGVHRRAAAVRQSRPAAPGRPRDEQHRLDRAHGSGCSPRASTIGAQSAPLAGIVIVTLALGIGSTTAIFSVVEAVLLRPLPYPEADRLVRIIERPAEPVNDVGYQQSLAAIWTRDLPAAASAGPDAVAYRRLFGCHGDGGRRSGQSAASRRDSAVPRGLRDAWCSSGARAHLPPHGRSAFGRASRRPQLFDVAAVLRWPGRRPRTQPCRGRQALHGRRA